ncbi:unnamed protein product [Scytosiphon promiscuus]
MNAEAAAAPAWAVAAAAAACTAAEDTDSAVWRGQPRLSKRARLREAASAVRTRSAPGALQGAEPGPGSKEKYYRGLGIKLIGESVAESSQRNYASGFRSWCVFRGLMGYEKTLAKEAPPAEMVWALIDFAAWCYQSEGNLATTISGELAAVQVFHRLEAQVEIITVSPLLKWALSGIARGHVASG